MNTFLTSIETIQAMVEENLEEYLTGTGAEIPGPHVVSVPMKDFTGATAAEQVELLPVIPKPNLTGVVMPKATYRAMALEAIALAQGGEGIFANFVETMVETNALGYENRLAESAAAQPGGGGGGGGKGLVPTDLVQPDNTVPDVMASAIPATAAPDPTAAPAAPAPGKTPAVPKRGKDPAQQQKFVDIFDTFKRSVNSDPNTGFSFSGRQRGIETFMGQFIWQWWTTGLCVVLTRWGSVPIPGLNYRPVTIPIEMDVLDPIRVDLIDLRTKGTVYYEFPAADKNMLINQVKQYGDPIKHPFFAMYPKKGFGNTDVSQQPVKQGIPQNVYSAAEAFAMLQSKSKIPLPPSNTKVIRRVFNGGDVYPIPFPARIFSAVNDKRLLRAMDRSLMRKVIMMILKVTVKSSLPNRPVRESDLKAITTKIQAQLQADPEYLQYIACPDGTDMAWVSPEGDTILNRDRYRTVDFEILSALVGMVANQLLNSSGNLDLSMIGKALWGKNQKCIESFRGLLEEVHDEILKRNNIRTIKPGDVNIVFKQISLYETDQFKTFVSQLVMRGLLPVKYAVDHMGEDYDTAIEYLKSEVALREQFGIFAVPPTNNQILTEVSPEPGQPGYTGPAANAPSQQLSGPGGRPPGAADTGPRQKTTGPAPTRPSATNGG